MMAWCKRGGSRGYVTVLPVSWEIGRKGSGWVLNIQPGREFESSVPRALHWLFSPHDPMFLKSALIHDTLLETGYRLAFADSQWVEAALSEGANPLKARLAYSAMRARRFVLWVFGR